MINYLSRSIIIWIIFLLAFSSAKSQDYYLVVNEFPYLNDTNYCCQQCFCEQDTAHFWVEKNGIKVTNRKFNWEIAYEFIRPDTEYIYIYEATEIYINVGDWGIKCDSFGGRLGVVGIFPNPNPDSIGSATGFNVVQCRPRGIIAPHRSSYCSNEPIAILQNSRSKPTSYQWYISRDGEGYTYYSSDTNFYAAELDVGSYSLMLIVSNVKGIDTAYTQFEVLAAPEVTLPKDQQIVLQQGTTTELSTCTIADSYHWIPDEGLSCAYCQQTTATISSDMSYNCIASNSNGCSDTCYYAISLPFSIYVPNAFSPNGDGTNDTYTVLGRNIEVMDMMIYNSWGNEVYRGNLSSPWDGSYQGSTVSAGVYGYYLSYRNKKTNTLHQKSGAITVVR